VSRLGLLVRLTLMMTNEDFYSLEGAL
jgi:hypothetical protein